MTVNAVTQHRTQEVQFLQNATATDGNIVGRVVLIFPADVAAVSATEIRSMVTHFEISKACEITLHLCQAEHLLKQERDGKWYLKIKGLIVSEVILVFK